MQQSVTCYEAFQGLLKTLCLKEFPCGFGTWRNPNDKFSEGQYSVTLKDYGVQYEKMEILQEYLNSGTWDVDTSWSNEAAALRSLAVSQPWKLDGQSGLKYIYEFFKTLRIIDKQVTSIDSNLLKLSNLEDLTLSVNLLTEVSSDHLPPKLKVLELCTNCLESISSLCKRPPPLLHIGLSHNKLFSTDEYKFFSVEYWPSLMSLDLSYNNLTGLVELVDRLSSLRNLRNLVLQGNPLSLVPGYRGHVIDALREITIFDDINVSADEKHHFKGLGKKKELILDEAQIIVTVEKLSGIPMPEELKEDDDRPQYPIVSSQYVVQYEMLKDFVPKTRDTSDLVTKQTTRDSHAILSKVDLEEETEIVFHETQAREWDDCDIDFEYKKLHLVDNLVALRDVLRRGIQFTILMKKTLAWPVTPTETPEAIVESPVKKSAKDGKDTPSKKDAKGKDKGGKTDKAKKKTGSKEPDSQLRSDPPTFIEIGSQALCLSGFLEGDHKVELTCHCGGGPMRTESELAKQENNMQDDIKTEVKVSRGKSGKRRTPSADKPKSKGKPGSAGKRKDKKVEVVLDVEGAEDTVPPPITVHVSFELHKWKTASDSLKQVDV